jgi:hypothetical protein
MRARLASKASRSSSRAGVKISDLSMVASFHYRLRRTGKSMPRVAG